MTVPRHSSPAVDPTLRRLLRITLGPLVWALRLLVSYAAAAIWCARSGTSAIAPLLTALLTVSALALVLLAALDWTSWRQYRSDAQEDRPTDHGRYRCLGHVALLLTLVSASAWSTPPCPPSLPEPAGKAPFALAAAYTLALATAFPFPAHMLLVAVAAPLTMASARFAVRPNWPATALESRMLRGTLPRNRSRLIVRWISTKPSAKRPKKRQIKSASGQHTAHPSPVAVSRFMLLFHGKSSPEPEPIPSPRV